MQSKEVKRQAAVERQSAYDKKSDAEKLKEMNLLKLRAKKERVKIARRLNVTFEDTFSNNKFNGYPTLIDNCIN